jgi:hypothetical protein
MELSIYAGYVDGLLLMLTTVNNTEMGSFLPYIQKDPCNLYFIP